MLVDKASIEALTQSLNSSLQNQTNTTTTANQILAENQSSAAVTSQVQSTVVTDSVAKGTNVLLQRLLTGPMQTSRVAMTTTASAAPVTMESNMAATPTTLPQLIDLPLSDGKENSLSYDHSTQSTILSLGIGRTIF